MRINKLVVILLTLILLVNNKSTITINRATELPSTALEPELPFVDAAGSGVTLQAASGATIQFFPENGLGGDGNPTQAMDLPHLVLKRNGALTYPEDRTLMVSIQGLQIPAPGAHLTLEIETQHGDPDPGGLESRRIQVFHETIWISSSGRTDQTAEAEFPVVFEQHIDLNGRLVKTPTDYYRYKISFRSIEKPSGIILYQYASSFAFLLENQWIVPLNYFNGEINTAGPSEFAIYYCDMFPFGTKLHPRDFRLPREEVDDFVRAELLPSMLEAIRTQTELWGFQWHEEWLSYRPEDGHARLSVALFQGEVWFHDIARKAGHAGISIGVDGGMGDYENLAEGIMATFHHELFHNLQRSIHLHLGGDGIIGGRESAWEFFSEGTAELATSVGQPEIQFPLSGDKRTYLRKAGSFVGREGISSGNLNDSITEISPYNAVVYWRYLYEQCGGLQNGIESPTEGMKVIRQTLETLYSGEIIDISSSTDLIKFIPQIMDRVFENTNDCPFRNYAASLSHFSRSIYMLKLKDGRCIVALVQPTCGFYDPNENYPYPSANIITHQTSGPDQNGAEIEIFGNIPNSFGIDLIDVILDPQSIFDTLVIEFTETTGAEFNLQIMGLLESEETGEDKPLPRLMNKNNIIIESSSDKPNKHYLSGANAIGAKGLGLVITRLDASEYNNPLGDYSIRIYME